MPAVRKVSKEQIIDAAVEVLRDDGFSAINARSVAKKLGCSTQPIYFSFKNMDELKAALTQRAIELHTQRVRDSLRAHEGSDSRYSSYGMGFVKFAAEEKQLFRWLYLEGEQPGAYQSDVLMQEVIGVIVDEFGYAEDVARRFHQDMIYFMRERKKCCWWMKLIAKCFLQSSLRQCSMNCHRQNERTTALEE